ncbi:MAG TPA: hypothetical protein VGG25_09895, partial [Streptosporangiaceae bacterium]
EDHGRLLATSGYYTRAMADRQDPNEFAVALTGVYATDPDYGAKLIGLMRRYDLYRYNIAALATPATTGPDAHAPEPHAPAPHAPAPHSDVTPDAGGPAHASPGPTATNPTVPAPSSPATAASPAGTGQAASIPGAPGPVAPGPAASTPAKSSPAAPTPAASAHATSAPATSGSGTAGSIPHATAPHTTAPRGTAPAAGAPGAAIPGVPGGGTTVTSAVGAGLGEAAVPGTPTVPPAVHRARSAPAPHTAAVPGVRTAAVYRAAAPGAATAGQRTEPGAGAPASFAGPASGSGPASGIDPAASVLAASAIAFAGAPIAGGRARTRAAGQAAGRAAPRATARGPRAYKARVPLAVQSAFNTTAKMTLLRNEPLYREVAGYRGLSWELLAACDWMQCEARARYSPVNGEKLGTPNLDGTVYRTRSEALDQCADDLVELSWAVYRIDVTGQQPLSVRELAETFAAFRWGGLLRLHRTSAMEFPYSVAGLTDQHLTMRWPNIADPNAPDKPGSRFRKPFGAVPIVLGLHYRAIA